MKYLFFDIECANCYNRQGKICSFGYVQTDEFFKVLAKNDLIINPDAPFDPHVMGQGENSINLAYSPIRFQYAPKFDVFYPQIAGLLTDKDTKVFGYAVENDVGFIASECARYQVPMPEFDYYDIQDIYRLSREWDRSPSLEDALNDLNVDFDEGTAHQSSEDALMSMLLLKAMAKQAGVGVDQLVAQYRVCHGTVRLFSLQQRLLAPSERTLSLPYDVDFRDKIRGFNEMMGYVSENVIDTNLLGYAFLFSPLCRQDIDSCLDLGNAIMDHSGELVRDLKEATHFVVYDDEEKKTTLSLFDGTSVRCLTRQEVQSLLALR
jgi:DNA polymerase III epsilon subunit-like protein